jgi:hypothetical protein
MKLPKWIAITQSAFPWEREALDFLRSHLPDHEPWRAWANFEFIDDEGRVKVRRLPEPVSATSSGRTLCWRDRDSW